MAEIREMAYRRSVMHGGAAPWAIAPAAFPEMGYTRRATEALDAATDDALRAIMRRKGVTLREAQEMAQWYHGPLAEA